MRDASRLYRKPQLRAAQAVARRRIEAARERFEQGVSHLGFPTEPKEVPLLEVVCAALDSALIISAYDREGALDLVAEAYVLLSAERDNQGRI